MKGVCLCVCERESSESEHVPQSNILLATDALHVISRNTNTLRGCCLFQQSIQNDFQVARGRVTFSLQYDIQYSGTPKIRISWDHASCCLHSGILYSSYQNKYPL